MVRRSTDSWYVRSFVFTKPYKPTSMVGYALSRAYNPQRAASSSYPDYKFAHLTNRCAGRSCHWRLRARV